MAQAAGPFHLHRPGPPLAEFVDFFWSYEGYAPPHDRERLLPTGTSELVFRLDASGHATAGITGARSESVLLDTLTPFSVVAVHFKPGGAFPFLPVPADDLQDGHATLEDIWGTDATSVSDRLWESSSPGTRFEILEEVLLTAARGHFERHAAVRYALDVFARSRGTCSVTAVVDRIGLSARRFGELFRAEVGMSPKMFCRVRRFNAVLARTEGRTDVDWADVALSHGYFDQAHFNHDFRAFAGLSPSAYLGERLSRIHVAVTGK